MTIRIILIEDHLLAMQGLSTELGEYPDIEIVATAPSSVGTGNLLQLIRENNPHLVILDFSLKGSHLDPFKTISTLRERCPETEIVVLIGKGDGIFLRWLISYKVMGCVFSDDVQVLSLGSMVRKVVEGKLAYSQRLLERYFHLSEVALTPRELDVLCLAAKGLSNGEIARQLETAPVTVRNHLTKIYAKLGVPQAAEINARVCALNAARQMGLIEPDIPARTG